MTVKPTAATSIPAQKGKTIYPKPFAALVQGRSKAKLGNFFGLKNYGVNLTRLEPGAISALFHLHTTQDEFIYILEGTATLVLGDEIFEMTAGDCMGFEAANGVAHQLVNHSSEDVTFLEIGDRSGDDAPEYPNDDIQLGVSPEGAWVFSRKNGDPF